MNDIAASTEVCSFHREALRIDGELIHRDAVIEVRNPYDGTLVGTVPKATLDDVRRAFAAARAFRPTLTRHERAAIIAVERGPDLARFRLALPAAVALGEL